MVLLNLLLYRNSFCGIFHQASVLSASCHTASFQGMEAVKGSNKKGSFPGRAVTRAAVSSWQRGHFGYLAAPTDVTRMWFCPCVPAFPFLCPGNQRRECSRFPCAVPWRRAMPSSLPLLVGILRSCLETLGAGAWWAGQRRWVFTRVSRKEYAKDVGTPLERKRGLWRPQSRWLLANLKTKPCSCGTTCCSPFPPGFRRSQVNYLAGGTPAPQTLWKYKRKKRIRHPNLPPAAGGRGGSGARAVPPH